MDYTLLQKLQKIEDMLQKKSEKPMCLNAAAEYLDISKSHLYKLTHRMEIPHYKPNGKKIYFLKSDLDGWVIGNPVKTIMDIEKEVETYSKV